MSGTHDMDDLARRIARTRPMEPLQQSDSERRALEQTQAIWAAEEAAREQAFHDGVMGMSVPDRAGPLALPFLIVLTLVKAALAIGRRLARVFADKP